MEAGANFHDTFKRPCYWCDTPTHYRVRMSFPVPGAGCMEDIQLEAAVEPMCKPCAAENGYFLDAAKQAAAECLAESVIYISVESPE